MSMKKSEFPVSSIVHWCLFAVAVSISLPACSAEDRYPAPPMTETEIMLNIADLPLAEPVFFTYRSQGKGINFFAIRFPERVLSFLDACVNCYPRRKGYAYGNGMVTCRACDTSYSIYKLEQGIGGCFPIRFDGLVQNGRYVIKRSVLDRHAVKF